MNDHRGTVKTFRDDIGFRERFVGISAGLHRSFLIIGMATTLYLMIWGFADGRENGVRCRPRPSMSFRKSSSTLKADAVLLKILC